MAARGERRAAPVAGAVLPALIAIVLACSATAGAAHNRCGPGGGAAAHTAQRVGAGVCCGLLRLRGGAPDVGNGEQALVESRRTSKGLRLMETTNKIRALRGKRVGGTLIETAATVVPGVTALLPNTLTDLQHKRKLNQLNAEEAEVLNLIEYQERTAAGRPRAGQTHVPSDAAAVATELTAVERELHSLRSTMPDAAEPEVVSDEEARSRASAAAAERRKAAAALVRKRGLLLEVQQDLQLISRYAAVQEEERDEDGKLVFQRFNHSMWLDALDDERLDDVDAWQLGLHDLPTSRYTSGWDKKKMGSTLSLDSKRRVVRGPYPPKDALMGSVRTLKPLPSSGVHYFEIVLRCDGVARGGSLGGGNYIGLVDGNVTDFEGCWELNTEPDKHRTKEEIEWGSSSIDAQDEDPLLPWTIPKAPKKRDGSGGVMAAKIRRREQRSRRLHFMALHDSCARPQVRLNPEL